MNPWELEPLYLRRPDAEIDWGGPARGCGDERLPACGCRTSTAPGSCRGSSAKTPPHVSSLIIQPMKRRHLRRVLRIEQQVYPRPWSLGLSVSELSRSGAASTSWGS